MTNIETYNRVSSLEPQRVRSILTTSYTSFIVIAVGSLAAILVSTEIWILSLGAAMLALLVIALIYFFDNHREKTCQFCKTPLSSITRPLILDHYFLSLRGEKIGDFFFTQIAHGLLWYRKRWTKISNRSLACHHCRLTEERTSHLYEELSPLELQQVAKHL